MNPRPLGYEPYDARLCRLGRSPAGAVTLTDGTDSVALGRLRLPCLARFCRVRFTSRFTEQPPDLRLPASASSTSLPSRDRNRVATRDLLIRRYLRGCPAPFTSVHDLGRGPGGCSSSSGNPGKPSVRVAPSVAPGRDDLSASSKGERGSLTAPAWRHQELLVRPDPRLGGRPRRMPWAVPQLSPSRGDCSCSKPHGTG